MTKTTVSTDLLQALQIITKFGIDTVGENLRILAIDDIALTIEEPCWDLVLCWVLDDGDDSLELLGGKFTGTVFRQNIFLLPTSNQIIPLVEIDIGLLANQVRVAASHSFYLSQCVHDLLLALDCRTNISIAFTFTESRNSNHWYSIDVISIA